MGIAVGIVEIFRWAYYAVLLFFICLAIWWPGKWWEKLAGVALVLLVIVGPVVKMDYEINKDAREEYKIIYPPAKALFDARCASAKEKIYKTVDNVSDILLLDVRHKEEMDNFNPHWANAGLPNESSGDNYIRSFMAMRVLDHWTQYFADNIPSNHSSRIKRGYSYVDVKEGDVFARYRYQRFGSRKLTREKHLPKQVARYAVSFTNDGNPEDRKHWVAGTTVTIKDTLTQEILAEKTWYALAIVEARPPGSAYSWMNARTCPRSLLRKNEFHGYYTRNFVEKVLKPKQEY